MGIEIDRDVFADEEFVAFDARLRECLIALAEVLDRPRFGEGPPSLGAELELHLVDAQGRPAPINRKVLASTVDPRVTLEVDRFNLEVNTRPVALAARPFSGLADELTDALGSVRRAAAQHGARAVSIGILPTLRQQDLTTGALTDGHRYRALAAGIARLRETPPQVRIQGEDELALDCADIAFEGANTSFQVHLRTTPGQFADVYNAAQIATAPVLAASCNSPLFLTRRLWDETRVALFRQATDDRGELGDRAWRPARVSFGEGWCRKGALELFAESVALHEPLLPARSQEDPVAVVRAGGIPKLGELRLHHGTVWRWNRAVYDDAEGGHLRVELRALPSGPTVTDMVANAAFLVGLTLALAPVATAMMPGLTFAQARRNFYQAARRGLRADLLWPDRPGERVRAVPAPELCQRLLPMAHAGLTNAGVAASEADRWLAIIAERVRVGQTGAVWQRRLFDRIGGYEGCARLLTAYLERSEQNQPVHTWDQP